MKRATTEVAVDLSEAVDPPATVRPAETNQPTRSSTGGNSPMDEAKPRIDGVVIGLLLDFNESRMPVVDYPGNPLEQPLPARSITQLNRDHVGRQIAILFEDGNPSAPIVFGLLQNPGTSNPLAPFQAEVDGKTLTLTAEEQIVLRCGRASITLTRAGKVLIRGEYLLSRSSGVNKIKGGSAQIN
jgi:hypothetical protein